MPLDKFGRDYNHNNNTSSGGVSVTYLNNKFAAQQISLDRLINEKIMLSKTIDNTLIKCKTNHTVSIANPNWSLVSITLKFDNEDWLTQINISRQFPDKFYIIHKYGSRKDANFLKRRYYAEVKISNVSDTSVQVCAGNFWIISFTNPIPDVGGILQTIVM